MKISRRDVFSDGDNFVVRLNGVLKIYRLSLKNDKDLLSNTIIGDMLKTRRIVANNQPWEKV